jgi:hypothetical protein
MCYVLLASTYLLCEQHIRLLDTTVGTFLGPPFEVYGSRANKKKVVRGRYRQYGGIEEPDMLLAQHYSICCFDLA